MEIMEILATVFWGISFALTALSAPVLLWQGAVGVWGLLPDRKKVQAAAKEPGFGQPLRFAAVVCARNEEAVIGALLDSLRAQDYPEGLLDLYVAADNCTDATAAVAARHGARVYERFNREQVGKGYALRWLLEKIAADRPGLYDAVAVFDADNRVTPGFLRQMDQALRAGADVAKGSRYAANPTESWVSGGYAVYWRSMMHFFHRARANCGLSCFVDGTGFAFKTELIRGEGWNTHSLVEDCEFSMQQICRGKTIVPVSGAVYYDEQPTSFAVSLRQRFRWTVGCVQCVKYCLPDAVRALRRGRAGGGPSRLAALDVILYLLLIPAVAASLLSGFFSLLGFLFSPPSAIAADAAFLSLPVLSWLGLTAGALLTLLRDRQPLRPMRTAVLLFPVFVLSMSAMALIAVLHPKTAWKPIAHRGQGGAAEAACPSSLPPAL